MIINTMTRDMRGSESWATVDADDHDIIRRVLEYSSTAVHTEHRQWPRCTVSITLSGSRDIVGRGPVEAIIRTDGGTMTGTFSVHPRKDGIALRAAVGAIRMDGEPISGRALIRQLCPGVQVVDRIVGEDGRCTETPAHITIGHGSI